MGPFPGPELEWGYTAIFSKENGGGFLTDYYPEAYKAIWDLHGIYATSRHVPGVKFAGISHPGLIGCAPSHELLAKWNEREAKLIATNPTRVPPLAHPPLSQSALLGSLKGTEFKQAAKEAARTVPPLFSAVHLSPIRRVHFVFGLLSTFVCLAANQFPPCQVDTPSSQVDVPSSLAQLFLVTKTTDYRYHE